MLLAAFFLSALFSFFFGLSADLSFFSADFFFFLPSIFPCLAS